MLEAQTTVVYPQICQGKILLSEAHSDCKSAGTGRPLRC